jgi:transcription elongation GreA/GreB family factor
MSVAFRRESDEEHLEPSFALPLPPGPNWVTAAGLALIERRLAEWTAAVEAAADDADALKSARRDLHYWQTRFSTAEIQPVPDSDEVAFGSRVRIRINGQERVVELVGSDEADSAAGRIPFTAPLAQAIIGLAPGDTADWQGKSDAIEVIETGPIARAVEC